MELKIQGDHSRAIEDQGNCLTFSIEPTPATSLVEDLAITIGLTINDGENAEIGTEIFFSIDLETAQQIVGELTSQIETAQQTRITILEQALQFKNAQMACIKGEVGEIEITKLADGNSLGMAQFKLTYFDDVERHLLYEVENVTCYVPAMQEEQYEWLRSLVGGNHQYTSTIKVSLVGLSLEQVRAEFEEQLCQFVAAQQAQ
jgi:hypothetical protein